MTSEPEEFRYMGPVLALIAYGFLVFACLMGIFVFAASEPVLAVVCGVGALLIARRAIFHHTHRLIVEADALVVASAFGSHRIAFSQVREIAFARPDSDRASTVMRLKTDKGKEIIPEAYVHFERLVEVVLQRCPQALVLELPHSEVG
ncbi:MAG: hypothetical protein ACO1SV_25520 [Fimbriimonas sp.]